LATKRKRVGSEEVGLEKQDSVRAKSEEEEGEEEDAGDAERERSTLGNKVSC
jgi:hypothetical protein